MTILDTPKIWRAGKAVGIYTVSLIIIAAISSHASPVAADTSYGYESDELRLVGSDLYDDSSRRRPFFDDRYVPDFGESSLILEARVAPYLQHYYVMTADARNIPTAIDGTRQSGPSGGAYLQIFPHHKFTWIAGSARGWLLARLKNVGDLDAFMPPFMLGPVCQFSTSMRWQRYADSFANGHPEVD